MKSVVVVVVVDVIGGGGGSDSDGAATAVTQIGQSNYSFSVCLQYYWVLHMGSIIVFLRISFLFANYKKDKHKRPR